MNDVGSHQWLAGLGCCSWHVNIERDKISFRWLS